MKVKIKCQHCGVEFIRQSSRKAKFCSIECARQGTIPWNKDKSGYTLPTRRNNEIANNGAKICNCKWCGKEFYNPAQRIKMNMMCCCLEHAKLYAKHKNTITAICKGCGKSFTVKIYKTSQTHKNGQYRTYCSTKCRKEHVTANVICHQCGKHFSIYHYALINKDNHFCSRKCLNEFQTLENAPSWKGGFHIANNTGHKIVMTNETYPKNSRTAKSGHHKKYRPEHRIAVEQAIGRKLDNNNEPIWHLNGIPTDNELHNLYVFSSRSEMMRAINGSIPFPNKSNVDMLKCQAYKD